MKKASIVLLYFISYAASGKLNYPFSKNSLPEHSLQRHPLDLTNPTFCDPNAKQTSGYIDIDKNKHFFFWFFESRSNPTTDPVVLWLNGGPGCSSLTGSLIAIGPCLINDNGDGVTYNHNAWNKNSSIIFLDQPLNTGFSYTDDDAHLSDSDSASEDVYVFLQLFFKKFPQFSNLDVHIAGESYAGHYIPALATTIYNKNIALASAQQQITDFKHINLKSLIIGNGLVDPLIQYKYFKNITCDSQYGSVLSEEDCSLLENAYENECKGLIQSCYDSFNVTNTACVLATSICNEKMLSFVFKAAPTLNMYDIRQKCKETDHNVCYGQYNAMKKFLDLSNTREALGLSPDIEYTLCSEKVGEDFASSGDWMRPYQKQLPPLLENGIRVLAYAGDADFICNWMGVRAWTQSLPWYGQAIYNSQNETEWYTDCGKLGGSVLKSPDNQLSFVRIAEAGHMAPFDQPEAAFDMFYRWIFPN